MFKLHKAARQGQLQVVNWLIEEEEKKIEECDKFQMTPLHYAAEFGHIKVTKFLIEKGANIEVENEDGNTPLHEAVDGGHFEVVKYLIEKGAQLDAKNKTNDTPRDMAYDRPGFLKFFVENGIQFQKHNCNFLDDDHPTLLHYVAHKGHLKW